MSKTNKIFWLCFTGVFLGLFLTSALLQASDINSDGKNLLGVKSNTKNFSLLDPARLKIYNSYTFSYFSSGNTSGSYGIYTTTLNYQLSNPLSLTLSLNYLHQPLSVFGRDDLRVKNTVLPNFQLNYRPNNNFSFMIDIVTFFLPYNWENENMWREDKRRGF
jgi:hypothetical protein